MNARRRTLAGLAMTLLMTGAAGCGGTGDEGTTAVESPAASSSPDSAHSHGEAPEGGMEAPSTTADPAARSEAVVARQVLLTWARPTVPAEQWWDDLEPMLSPSAREAYAYTDPSILPALKITGTPTVEKSTVTTWALVWFPTNDGRYGVQLSRTSETAAWTMSRIWFPGTAPDQTGNAGQASSSHEDGDTTTGSRHA